MKMDFSVGLGRNERIDEIAGLSRAAEDAGFSHISFIDSQNLSRDVYPMMTIASLSTNRIKIGHGVTNPFTRHPSVTANATATIDEISGGRAFLGIGVGSSSVRTMNMKPVRQKEYREYVEFIRKYMSGEEAEWQGAKMHSEWVLSPVPIYMGASGPRACQAAGELGDGIIHSGCHPVIFKWMMENLEKGATKAGRDYSKIDVWARGMIYVAESKEAARREVASQAASGARGKYLAWQRKDPEVVDLLQRLERVEPGIVDEFRRVCEAFDNYQHERADAPHAKLVSQRVIDFFMFTGTPEDICEQISKVQRLGAKNISTQVYTVVDKKGMMREIRDRIMPHFRS